jgi:CheY-like chemotaxis protein
LPPNALQTIDRPWAALLLQIVRQVAKNGRQNSLGRAGARPPDASKTGKKILAIDDTEMLLIFVADVLGTADQTFQIITASTGGEGLRLAARTHPDLVLLDYSLTDMNGDDVCRALLANEMTARIPVLMMSGHLTEMATTAQRFGNVVATLAKPFLSGALISAVEKVLAAGPLPKVLRPPPERKVPPPRERSPNEQRVPGASAKNAVALEAAIPAEGPPIVAMAKLESRPMSVPVVARPEMSSAAAPYIRRTEVSVTLALEVIAVQLTPAFQLDALKLQMTDPTAAVKVTDREATGGVALETGFRLGTVGLSAEGQADTVRLIPTRQPPQLVVGESSFTVGGLNVQLAAAQSQVELTAPERTSMCVQLTAQFEILTVELSERFEVVAVLLKSSSRMVRMSNGAGIAGAQFEMKEVQLNPLAQLETLMVRVAS